MLWFIYLTFWPIVLNTGAMGDTLTGKAFHLHTDRRNWNEARSICETDGGRLAVADNTATMEAIIAYSKTDLWSQNIVASVWIGLNKEASSDTDFRWDHCEPKSSYAFWATGDPKNPSNAHCVFAQDKDLKWKSESCRSDAHYLCEFDTGPCQYIPVEWTCLSAAYGSYYPYLNQTECEDRCSADLNNNLACWLYVYDSHGCTLYFDGDPEKCSQPDQNSPGAGVFRSCFTYNVTSSTSSVEINSGTPLVNCDLYTNSAITTTSASALTAMSSAATQQVAATATMNTSVHINTDVSIADIASSDAESNISAKTSQVTPLLFTYPSKVSVMFSTGTEPTSPVEETRPTQYIPSATFYEAKHAVSVDTTVETVTDNNASSGAVVNSVDLTSTPADTSIHPNTVYPSQALSTTVPSEATGSTSSLAQTTMPLLTASLITSGISTLTTSELPEFRAATSPSEGTVSSSHLSCKCHCLSLKNNTEIQKLVDALLLWIRVDPALLSATRRKKQSARDDRPTAQALGWSGTVFLLLTVAFFVFIDVIRICHVVNTNTVIHRQSV